MDHLSALLFAGDMHNNEFPIDTDTRTTAIVRPDPSPADPTLGPVARKAVTSHSYAVMSTTSEAGRPHAAGVMYQLADGQLWISTMRSSRKARNVLACGRAAVSIPARRIPVGPPSTVQFQGRAEVVSLDHPDLLRLASAGELRKVTGHGELDLDDGCFIRITPPSRVPLYGLGMSIWSFARHPLEAGRVAQVDWSTPH